jgi:hypothetical protein
MQGNKKRDKKKKKDEKRKVGRKIYEREQKY